MRNDSAKPTLVVTGDLRLFVADNTLTEVLMPVMAKALFLTFLRHPEGLCFDESFKARKALIEAYNDITHCPLDEAELGRVISLTEPPKGDIKEMCEVIHKAFVYAVGRRRAGHFVVECSNPDAVRIALPKECVKIL